jgi:hypothetical protein
MRRLIFAAVAVLSLLSAKAQTWDPNNSYLVWTKNVSLSGPAQTAEGEKGAEAEKAQSFEDKYFSFVSLCDWREGMRFMVLPDKKDLVIKVFTNAATKQMVSTMSLRYKIMEYRGHSGQGQLHERIDFYCVDDSTNYYYEIPSATFEDYCYTKFGVPALAYLGDVDIARRELLGKTLTTVADDYNVDVNNNGYGWEDVFIPKGTEVKVVAIGVGTRSFPVKIIVEDGNGKQFFQNIAFSRTNSGMRDEEFEEDNLKHIFRHSFNLESDNEAADNEYGKYLGKTLYTNYVTKMLDTLGIAHNIKRLDRFTVKKIRAKVGTNYVKMTLVDRHGQTWTKDVTFVQEDVAGDIDGRREDYFYTLFTYQNVEKDINPKHMDDISKRIVRPGFTEAEVRLALGEPDGHGSAAGGSVYTWTYNSVLNARQCTVFFWKKTKRVRSVKQ